MNNKVKSLYNQSEIADYRGNPLIEALPPILDDRGVLKKLKLTNRCPDNERQMASHLRKKLIRKISNFVEPFISYLEVFRAMEDAILEGYAGKNPFSPTTQHYLHYLNNEDTSVSPRTGAFISRGCALTVVGVSGSGKSYMIDRILETYPQVIHHKEYDGKKLNLNQLVWLKVNCPENTLLSTFSTIILDELDRVTGSDDAMNTYSSRMNIGKALVQVERKLRLHFVGVVVIDEIQNLSLGNKKIRQQFLNFIIKLIDRSGIPIVLCGNPEIVEVLHETLRNSRRAESGGYFVIDSLSRGEWKLFIRQLWKSQWTNVQTDLTDELSDCLYDLSTGLPDFAVRIYQQAQKIIIGTREEVITTAVLHDAYTQACVLSDKALTERREINILKNDRCYDDAHVDKAKDFINQQVNLSVNDNKGTRYNKKDKERLIDDVYRVQHPEFKDSVLKMKAEGCKAPKYIIKDLLRQSFENESPLSLGVFINLCQFIKMNALAFRSEHDNDTII